MSSSCLESNGKITGPEFDILSFVITFKYGFHYVDKAIYNCVVIYDADSHYNQHGFVTII